MFFLGLRAERIRCILVFLFMGFGKTKWEERDLILVMK